LLDVAIFCILKHPHKLTFLGYRGLDDVRVFLHFGETEEDKKMQAMPSWVPNWRPEDASNPYTAIQTLPKAMAFNVDDEVRRTYSPCKRPTNKVSQLSKFKDDAALNSYFDLGWNGIRVDRVGKMSEPCHGGNFNSIEHEWAPDNLIDTYSFTRESIETAFLHTLVADVLLKAGQVISRDECMYWRGREAVSGSEQNEDRIEALRRAALLRHFI
jgi:hypothetical protein